MIVRVARRVQAAIANVNVLVATDSMRVLKVLEPEGILCVMTDQSHTSGSDRIAQVADLMAWPDDDIVINVQGDEPAIPVEMLRSFGEFCQNTENLETGTIIVPVGTREELQNPNIVKVVVNKLGEANYFSRAALPVQRDSGDIRSWPVNGYFRHVGVYGYRLSVLREFSKQTPVFLEEAEKLEQLRILWMGFRISTLLWKESPPTGVDTPEDASHISNLFLSGALT
ncbi:MAG: 3-deoxy-manno-octulosonate cytidylyltransferase [Aureliella sp.]